MKLCKETEPCEVNLHKDIIQLYTQLLAYMAYFLTFWSFTCVMYPRRYYNMIQCCRYTEDGKNTADQVVLFMDYKEILMDLLLILYYSFPSLKITPIQTFCKLKYQNLTCYLELATKDFECNFFIFLFFFFSGKNVFLATWQHLNYQTSHFAAK